MKATYSNIKTGFTTFILAITLFSCTSKPELRALIITGEGASDMRSSYLAIRNSLESKDIFTVYTATAPRRNISEFIVDFEPFDVVVLNNRGSEWPEETKDNFINYVKNGGGVLVSSIGSQAFPDWEEYQEIIGLQGEEPDEEIEEAGEKTEYTVEASLSDHPVVKGLPEKWLHTTDFDFTGPEKISVNTETIATINNVPIIVTGSYGEGRIINIALGQSSGKEVLPTALECVGFITLLQRGAEWAATGQVTQKVPKGFPDNTESVRWRYYEPLDIKIISKRIKGYEMGNSTNCFTALKDLIAENANDESMINEYNEMIIGLLRSGSASIEGKKILLKEFSWMATEEFKSIYEELTEEPALKEEAMFALARLK